jgi:DNA invertase Pin-like site-specific DNA recombinase
MIAEEFIEIETGKGSDALEKRPVFAAALKKANKLKAPLVVAKLDRLSRCRLHFGPDVARNPVHQRR